MKRILIADDEYFVRMGIKSTIEWKESEFIVETEAENGNEAEAMILENEPDIVFLDITMPGQSGLEVLEKVRKRGYGGYIVMLTCHEDFRMVQQAMRIGADDYVLKNDLTGEKMLDYLRSIPKERLEGSGERKMLVEEKNQAREYKQNFLKNMLCFGGIENSDFQKLKERFGFSLAKGDIYMLLLEIRDCRNVMQRYEGVDVQILFRAVDNLMNECLKGQQEAEHFWMDASNYIVLMTFSGERSEQRIAEWIQGIVRQISYSFENFLNIRTTIALHRHTGDISRMNTGYESLRRLKSQRFFYPDRDFFSYREFYRESGEQELEELLRDVLENKESFSGALLEYKRRCGGERTIRNRERVIQLIRRCQFQLHLKYGIEEETLEECETIDQVIELAQKQVERLEQRRRQPNCGHLVHQALQIIESELDKDLMLDDISERLGVSSGYFSRVFSREMGQTYSSYVIERRVEKSKELIRDTNLKFYEIAQMCGFHSSVHFNNMFKRVCQITPNQYRKECHKEQET